jgi:hypothetical protein
MYFYCFNHLSRIHPEPQNSWMDLSAVGDQLSKVTSR